MKFTEAHLELSFIDLLTQQSMQHRNGKDLRSAESLGVQEPKRLYGHIATENVLLLDELRNFLKSQYAAHNITAAEIDSIVRNLERLPASDLYESNKAFMKMLSDGFVLKREDRQQKDFLVHLIDFSSQDNNTYTIVNQLAIKGFEMRIPDLIIYINGLPLVVFEFKSTIQENTTIHDAYVQLTKRYQRDIPELFKYSTFCVISDGVNTKAGSFFAPYDFYYAWRKIAGMDNEVDGVDAMFTMIQGMFHKDRLRDIIQNFIFLPDSSKKNEKIVCRYPQYYAANKLFDNIILSQKPLGNGKGGTYFGTTGCGKSYTMLYLCRLLMRSTKLKSPTIVLITDRTDLDDQLSAQFTNAKGFIGDETIISVESRVHLRELLQDRNSGGVFLTTIHKFTEDTQLLTDRYNVICISDEAHRSQTNLNQKLKETKEGLRKTYGFAKHLHDSLPNATYVGFTGTPVDATIEVFGDIIDSYTMRESVKDEITVPLVYEGRAAKLLLQNDKLAEIEKYYSKCAEEGSNENQIEESKNAMSQMNVILGDPSRIKALAEDFVNHYEKRVEEKSTIRGKALFVCSNREIAYDLYKAILKLRPKWGEPKTAFDPTLLSEKERRELVPIEQIKLVMTRNKDDEKELYDLLGTKDYRKELDRQFKFEHSNFKIAIVVDMWLTGFDVPFLDTIYIDKPLQRHNLIQTISRVNRKFEGKEKGLVVDYIGIKKQMNLALAQYNNNNTTSVEDVEQSVKVVKDHLSLLENIFHTFDATGYFNGTPLEQLSTLNKGAEFIQATKELETRFMNIVKRLKAAFDICSGSDLLSTLEKDKIHFYVAIRSIIYKLTKGNAPDATQMNEKVRIMIQDAIESQGVEELFKLNADEATEIDLFSEDYLAKLDKIKLPHTKFKLLLKLLQQAIDKTKKVNKVTGIDFSKRLEAILHRYNQREENDILRSEVLEDFTDEIIALYHALMAENNSLADKGIDFEEKAFYDILKMLTVKYDFPYPEEKLVVLAKKVKEVVDDKAKYTDWSKRDDIKAELKVDLIILLADNDYPPIDRDEVYKEIFEQAENFKKSR
ncbi:type I restriction endonuclease subunit R [Flavobacterium sp. CYK-4]|uniref:type I restriction endonuclease subunit R n=1 Tax=Flavobacterium lotistagni TaxID=2709660 RepID=UPI00140BDAAD|nr:HsdR family type I site-specific deoxyribonuclease [Flavobacterium lotistagni]NHM08047.1 type I restriction endonuclease subunit R [Flavobacterium lotistagni]